MAGDKLIGLGITAGHHYQPAKNTQADGPTPLTPKQRLYNLVNDGVTAPEPDSSGRVLLITGFALAIVMRLIGMGVIPAMLVTAFIMWMAARGRRMQAPHGPDTVIASRKFPILYLRAFSDDQQPFGLPLAGGGTPEEKVLAVFRKRLACPVVALSDPKQELPMLGALRLWVQPEMWENKVTDFMACAPLVILRFRGTNGVMWELNRAVSLLDPQRLVVVLPSRRFWQSPSGPIVQELNNHLPKPVQSLSRGVRFLVFESDWTPIGMDRTKDVLETFSPAR